MSSLPWVYPSFEGARLHTSPSSIDAEYKVKRFSSPLRLENGGSLPELDVAYETYGTLSSDAENAVLICHALTGDSHVSRHDSPASRDGWWEGMVGPGLPFDTRRFFVICSNVLGGCRGTTGPRSISPATGRVYGAAFPKVTIRDMVSVQRNLLASLGINRLACVAGGSMGGMQALEWAVGHPDSVRACIALGTPNRVRAQALAYSFVQRAMIERDTRWRDGDYSGRGPVDGLSLARMLAMITYQSEQSMERKFGGRDDKGWGRTRLADYLEYQGRKLVGRFDASSYVCLLEALDGFDLGRNRGGYRKAIARIQAKMMIAGISSDILYPVAQQRELAQELVDAGKDVTFEEIDSPHGHDAFLLETRAVGAIIARFMNNTQVGSR